MHISVVTIDLTSNWENITTDHNNGSKIYPQNQVIFDCFMPSTSV